MEKISERIAVVATIDPDVNTTATYNTDWIDMQDFTSAMFVVLAGVLADSGTLDFTVQEAKTATGGSAQALATGVLNMTQLTTGDNDTQSIIDVGKEDLTQAFRYVRGVLVVAVNSADCAVIALGNKGTYQPASAFDLASVNEIIG